MEASDAADVIICIDSHSDNLDLDKEGDVEESGIVVGDPGNSNSITTETGKENVNEDQDSVIIDEEAPRIIDLNEESEEEIELEIVQNNTDLPNSTNNSDKATEFVIVNAANLLNSTNDVADQAVEDIQIKDELTETITADVNTNDVLENDPMDLLELNPRSECSSSARSQEETDYADDGSSIGSSSVQTGSTSSANAADWIKDYPWMLYDEEDQMGYCLYCDAKINSKSQRCVKQHGMSLYHKERCENYAAFREEEEKNGLGTKLVDIKEEFGTDNRVAALKLKRKTQSAALNNFNWRRWLENYPWLERDSPEGSIGFCKYCLIHVNVEFSYLRDRHQEGSKHREAEKQYETSTDPQHSTETANTTEAQVSITTDDNNSSSRNNRWLQVLDNETGMVRCKLCDSKMWHNNFARHLNSKVHEQNEKIYLESGNADKSAEHEDDSQKNQQSWKMFLNVHPWMTAAPGDPSLAYCMYCEKRIYYGSSASKRALHENSYLHKQNALEFKKRSQNDKKQTESDTQKDNEENNDNQDEERNDESEEEEEEEEEEDGEGNDQNEENVEDNEEDGDDEEENESDDAEEEDEEEPEDKDEGQGGKESGNENETKKRPKRLSEEWLKRYPWCKIYKKDPNFICCTYCRSHFQPASRGKHQNSSMHKAAEKEFLRQQGKKPKTEEKKTNNEIYYEWAVSTRNDKSSYSCLYCRARISKHYSKKQHAASKIHQINESIYKSNRGKYSKNEENSTESSQPPATATKKKEFAKVVIKAPSAVAIIKQHQKKFPFLSYKRTELRTHYGHCKVCDTSLYVRSFKHIMRHARSSRHIRLLKAKKKQASQKAEETTNAEVKEKIMDKVSKEELQTSSEATKEKETLVENDTDSRKAYSYKSTLAEMKKRYSWIEKSESENTAYCRFCNTNIPLKIIFLRNHTNSQKHRYCVINFYSREGKKATKDRCEQNQADAGNDGNESDAEADVQIVEDNNEEILISEQDENWTIKSETMDEHEELDYLLQRSFNNPSNTHRNVRKSVNLGDEPPTKRVKRSQSFKRLNDSNSSLVASLLTTPLTLASCLGPIIQQQIQQANLSQIQNNLSATTATEVAKSSSAVSEPENTYDLFFKSVSETMKKLPIDLAAEGKLRVMQVLCDLELQALKRDQNPRAEMVPSNIGEGLVYQSTATRPVSNTPSHSTGDISGNVNETIIAPFTVNIENSPPSSNNFINPKVTNTSTVERPTTSTASPIIGVMDKNGLQTLQLKPTASKPIQRNTTTTVTSGQNSGIRCIPFKNLSQSATPDSSNQKVSRMQVPMNNSPTQAVNQNSNTVNNAKNLINFRNIQITKRLGTPPSSVPPTPLPQQTLQKPPSTVTNKNSQRSFIANIQPQLQRWGSSVNGSTSYQTPTSTTIKHLQQLSSQRTSTPITKK